MALGAALLMLAVPRTIAGWEAIAGGRALATLSSAQRPTKAELRDGIEGLRRSTAVVASSAHLIELGWLEFEQSQEMFPNNPARGPLLEASETHLVDALKANPVNGTGWYRLAQVRQARGAPSRQIAIALMQSLDMAPSARWLWMGRAQGLFTYASTLQEDELIAAHSQLRSIWRSDAMLRPNLVSNAIALGSMSMLSSALEGDAEEKAELEKLRQGARPK